MELNENKSTEEKGRSRRGRKERTLFDQKRHSHISFLTHNTMSSSSQWKGKGKAKSSSHHSEEALIKQSDSIASTTRIPISLQQSDPSKGKRPPKTLSKIPDKKLRSQLSKSHLSQQRAKEHVALAQEYLHAPNTGEESGFLETETPLERTFKVTQSQIKSAVSIQSAEKSFNLNLKDLGPYRCDYSRNGRHLLIGGRKGHLATFDWQSGKLGCEIQVRETVRDVKWLHNQDYFAVAQKKYTFIYDAMGTEIHRLKSHLEVQRMEFLPYHFLLATVVSFNHCSKESRWWRGGRGEQKWVALGMGRSCHSGRRFGCLPDRNEVDLIGKGEMKLPQSEK